GANPGGDRPDLLPVDTGDHDLGRPWCRDRNALRNRIADVVTVAQLDLEILALHRGAIADAGDLKSAFEAFRDSGYDIGQQRAIGAPHGAGLVGFAARIDPDLSAFHFGLDIAVQDQRKGALRSLYLDYLPLHAGGDARG